MVFRVCLAIAFITLITIGGCPKQVKNVAQTAKAMLDSPRMVTGDRSVYSLGQAEWGPDFFNLSLVDGRPLIVWSAPDGLRLAVADKEVPQAPADWQQFVLDSSPKPLFVRVACEGTSAFACFKAGGREDPHWWLASCIEGDLADAGSWTVEELTADLDISLVWSVIACDGRLGLLYRQNEPRRQAMAWREIGSAEAGWQTAAPEQFPEVFRQGEMLYLDGTPAVGYTAKDRSELWLATMQEGGEWSSVGIIGDPANTEVSMFGASFRSVGPAVGATYLNGEPATLQFAFTGDATAAQPHWTVTDVVSWGMLGRADVAFHGKLPIVTFAADTGIFAFIADNPAPAGPKDWGMCVLCDNLGELQYNGIAAQVVDDRLITAYIASDQAGNVTLDVTVLDLR